MDSRYYLQADQEVDPAYFRVHKLGMEGAHTLTGWLTEMERQPGSLRMGFDPFSTSTEAYTSYVKALKNAGSALVPITPNLVDAVWEDCPAPPAQPIYSLPDEVTGRSVADKLTDIRAEVTKAGANVLILTKLDQISWVTNLRGSDVSHNPVFEAYLVIEREHATCLARGCTACGRCSRPWQPRSRFRTTGPMPRLCSVWEPAPELTVWLDAAGTTMGTRLLLAETPAPAHGPYAGGINESGEKYRRGRCHAQCPSARCGGQNP